MFHQFDYIARPLKLPLWYNNLALISYTGRAIANFISKQSTFYYHGNWGPSKTSCYDTIKLADPENPSFAGHILSVESNQNVQSKWKNVESKIWKCGAQTRSVFLLLECKLCNAGLCVILTCCGCRLRRLVCLHSYVQTTSKKYFENTK